jgi:DNA polymerase III alpha subunit
MKNFATCHSHPQSLDSGSTPEAFAKREVELGTGVLTATDHGSLAACRKIYDLAKKNSLIPVLGMEAYLRDDSCPILAANGYRKNAAGAFIGAPKYMHVTLHFGDQAAYECAVRLLSNADERLEATLATLEPEDRRHGQERKPLFKWADLEELGAHNTTMTTGCMIGAVQRHLLDHDDLRTAEGYFAKLKSIVKPGNLYTELNPHDTSQNWVEGVFLTMKDGTKLRWYDGKTLKTDKGEIKAGELAKQWSRGEHKVLLAVKNRRVWEDLPPVEIANVEMLRGYLPNECRPWAPDGDLQAGLNKVMRILARKYDVKILVGDDSHYATPDEKVVQNVRLAQAGAWRFFGSYHRMSSDEAFAVLSKKLDIGAAEFEGWVENSHEWAGRFKDFKFHTPPSLPVKFYEEIYQTKPWHKGDKDDSLRYTMELIQKHGRMNWQNPAMVQRLKTEIELLHNNGTIDLLPYLMVDEEVCSFFEEQKLLTGPGRGSAAGLILTYLLGITHVDPLKYKLSLERFITLDRIASGGLPDIDQDLPKLRRGLLIDDQNGWLKKRFGDHYAQISVDSTLRLRMAVQDVSRERRDHVPKDIYSYTKKFMMPPMGMTDHDFVLGNDEDGEKHIVGSVEYDPALKAYIQAYPGDWEIVQKCLGLPRHKGKHACAFVIANRPISEFIPLTTVTDGRVTAYTAHSVEAVGGLKMDFLGLGALDDITDCISLIQGDYKEKHAFVGQNLNGKYVPGHHLVPVGDGLADIWDLPDDQDVFTDVALGRTETVFQFSTPGAVQWLRHFAHKKPDGRYAISSIEDMAAFTALDRPGALKVELSDPNEPEKKHNALVEFARRSRGEDPTPDILQVFNDLIPETYGVMVYQEQLQFMYQQITGCTGAEAEKFRKLVAKKELDKIQKLYEPFLENGAKLLGSREMAVEAWKFFISWAKYGFNKSHSVAYVTVSYACAYLKHHFPLHWWCAVLRNASKNEVSEKFWRHVSKFIDLPDVKLSGDNYEIQGDRIRMPLSQLMGVGDAASDQLKMYAPYTDIADFCQKIALHTEKTGTWIPKTKIKKVKVLDVESGKKVSHSVEVVEKVLKRGHNSLNRKVVRACLLTGAMDSLFPPDTHIGEKFEQFEAALAAAMGKKKPAPVDPALWDIGPIARYQTRKQILPTYGEDLAKLIVSKHGNAFFETDPDTESNYMGWTPPNSTTHRKLTIAVVGAGQLEQLEIQRLGEGQSMTVAVCAYVEAHELRAFGDDKEKEMCKLQLDIDGGRYEYVAWPKKDSNKVADVYRQPLKGAVVIAILNRWKDDKPFGLSDLFVVEPPKGKEKEEEDEPEAEPANAGRDPEGLQPVGQAVEAVA